MASPESIRDAETKQKRRYCIPYNHVHEDEVMDQSGLDFWERHSLHFLEMAFETHKRETLEKPDGYGIKVRECGDTVEIFLMLEGGKIRSASFETNGCLYAVACANAVVHLAEGKSIHAAHRLTPAQVREYLVTLPEKEAHCAALAVDALRTALDSIQERRQALSLGG